jgi:hypothetical protein
MHARIGKARVQELKGPLYSSFNVSAAIGINHCLLQMLWQLVAT